MAAKLNVALFAPRIAQNTGQIARTCYAMDLGLHLIRPLGFRIDAAILRRAAVGYWEELHPVIHESGEAFWTSVPDPSRVFLITKHGSRDFRSVDYSPGDFLLFGNETDGLPPEWIGNFVTQTVMIPMSRPEARCLNLATAASALIFEALRLIEPPPR